MAKKPKETKTITDTFLKSLKAAEGKALNIPCGEGLSLRVSPKGKKTWYLRYDTLSPDGKRKQNLVCLGEFHDKEFNLKNTRVEAIKQKRLAKMDYPG